MSDDEIIHQRIASRSVREIDKARRATVSTISEVIDRWAASAIDDKIRKNALALELARLDELQETFYARALEGDVECGALVTKLIERRCVMFGLHTPQMHTRQIVDDSTPQETGIDKIERVLAELAALDDKKNDPTTH